MRVFVFALFFAGQLAFASIDDTLLSLAPPSTTVLTGIDVTRAAASRSGIEMLRQVMKDQGLANLDFRRDLKQLLIVGFVNGSNADSPDALLASGTFVPSRLIAVGRSDGATLKQFRGVPVLAQGNGTGIAFPQPGILVAGKLAAVYKVIAARKSSMAINSELRGEVSRIGTQNDVWYATVLSGSFLIQQVGSSLPSQLRNSDVPQRIAQSSGGLQFRQNDDAVTLDLVAHTPADARSLSYLLRLAGGLAQLPLGGNPGFLLAEGVLRSMQVTLNGATLRVTSSVSDAEIERALASGA